MRVASKFVCRRIRLGLLLAMAVASSWPLTAAPIEADGMPVARLQNGRTVLTVRFEPPELETTAAGTRIQVAGCDADIEPGAPALPMRAVTIPVPEGYRSRTVSVIPANTRIIHLQQLVAPAEAPVALSKPYRRPAQAALRNETIYGRALPYPDYESPRTQRPRRERRHGDESLVVTLYPVQYLPADNLLHAHGELQIVVAWELLPATYGQERVWRPKHKLPPDEAAAVTALSPLTHASPTTLEAETESAYAASSITPQSLGPESLPGPYEHVIIAPANFISNTPPPWNLAALSEARRRNGLNSTQVSIEWVSASYEGRDNAEKMRNFIRDAYDQWGTRFVLLAGTAATVPTRLLYCSFPEATASIPADAVYFGCLDGSFDGNRNNVFGELNDGEDGWDVDLVAEVHVGRLPAATTDALANMVRKTLAYEALPAEALSRVSHVGEWLGFGGASEYASGAMEQIRQGSSSDFYTSTGFLNSYMSNRLDATDTLYDAPGYSWPTTLMLERFNQNFHVFNHLGHGATKIGFKLDLAYTANGNAIATLTNAQPYFIYSQACDMGRHDSNDSVAQQFLSSAGGPFAAVMNSRSGWGYADNVDGPSQRFNRRFWDAAFEDSDYYLGVIQTRSREKQRNLLSAYSGNVFRWIYYELTFFGDPATPFAAPLLRNEPAITAAGMQQNYYPGEPLTVTAQITPAGLIDHATALIVWRTSFDPGILHTNALTHQTQTTYTVTLPPQPLGAVIDFTLYAATRAGLTTRWPAAGTQQTIITKACSLAIRGQPAEYGDVVPGYGDHVRAAGNTVRATAPARVFLADGYSQACLGAAGTGSAPTTTGTDSSFVISTTSQLTWLWTASYLLRQTSNIPQFASSAHWYNTGEIARTQTAPGILKSNGVEYRFIGWWLDDTRQPSPSAPAKNPLLDIAMLAATTAKARYISAATDSDGDGIADWWLLRYFGNTDIASIEIDGDNDGYTLAEEFEDHTDPTNPASLPAPPSIRHDPLNAVQTTPPPYQVRARITDTRAVTKALLRWRHNDGAWVITPMAQDVTGIYTNILPAPATFGDSFTYEIEAFDPGGRTSRAGPFDLFLEYPRVTLAPVPEIDVVIPKYSATNICLSITNSGNADLHWRLYPALFDPVTEATAATWKLNAYNQSWSVSTNRSFSPPRALLGAPKSAGNYNAPPVYAGLRSPLVTPGPGATLAFRYWIASELNRSVPGYAFDAMLVEVSTNGGATYTQLPGPYTHRLTGWSRSPWPQDTPCFAGNGSEGWREATFDLSQFSGQPIYLRFVAGGDNNTDGEGCYLDDCAISTLREDDWPAWLVPTRTNDSLTFAAADTLPLHVDSTATTNIDLRQRIVLVSNDPLSPQLHTDLLVAVRATPWIGTPEAWQSDTNGDGIVTIAIPVAEADGLPLQLFINHATNDAAPWTIPLLANPVLKIGATPEIDTQKGVLHAIPTADGTHPATNLVTVQWNTRSTLPPLPPLAPGVRLRMSVSNGWYGTGPVTTVPFMVDNEPPSPPVDVAVTSHQTGLWSRNINVAATWQAANDGDGCGGLHYRSRISEQPAEPLDTISRSPNLNAALTSDDGSNLWLAVQALDACGNASETVLRGPYRIDATPPSTAGASVSIERSDFGAYAIGPHLSASWREFEDAHSGVAAYLLLLQTPGGMTFGEMTPLNQTVVSNMWLNATNSVVVYAIDVAGNIGLPVSDSILVLDPADDWDSDGYANSAEELAGTDAIDASSVLRLFTRAYLQPGGGIEIFWHGLEGRRYTLHHAPALAPHPSWQPVPDVVKAVGTGGTMTHRPGADQTAGFYKLVVE